MFGSRSEAPIASPAIRAKGPLCERFSRQDSTAASIMRAARRSRSGSAVSTPPSVSVRLIAWRSLPFRLLPLSTVTLSPPRARISMPSRVSSAIGASASA